MSYLIFDAGPIINFAMNSSLHILRRLKKDFKGDFLITKEVKREIIDKPLTIKKFQLEALQIKQLYDEEIIKLADITPKEVNELREIRENLMRMANHMFKTKKKEVKLIDKGESASLALSIILKKKGQDSVLVIDERTARMLIEGPENLRRLLEKKLHTSIKADKKSYLEFRDFRVIRSTELAYIAYKKGLFNIKDKILLESVLYGLKFRGCSISDSEIEEVKNLSQQT